jgi:hypothetical protein
MGIDVHLYANGNDPFTFPLEPYIFHVHAGPPPPPPDPPLSPDITSTSSRISGVEYDVRPETTVISEYPTETPISPPIRATAVHGADDVREWLQQADLESGDQPIRFRLDAVSGPLRPEIQTLFESLHSFGERGVNVDIVGWSEPGSE